MRWNQAPRKVVTPLAARDMEIVKPSHGSEDEDAPRLKRCSFDSRPLADRSLDEAKKAILLNKMLVSVPDSGLRQFWQLCDRQPAKGQGEANPSPSAELLQQQLSAQVISATSLRTKWTPLHLLNRRFRIAVTSCQLWCCLPHSLQLLKRTQGDKLIMSFGILSGMDALRARGLPRFVDGAQQQIRRGWSASSWDMVLPGSQSPLP